MAQRRCVFGVVRIESNVIAIGRPVDSVIFPSQQMTSNSPIIPPLGPLRGGNHADRRDERPKQSRSTCAPTRKRGLLRFARNDKKDPRKRGLFRPQGSQ